ncbi:Aminoacylase-1 [Phytophthora idaei]|nr:Aminoacylase-1 [Phytophthora idaei]KAG3149179.1 Aminoacylase-1 [Phytophthora idaei]KAG3241538.1 Aminoacylase-1 [Phytophthora idaei]
MATRTSSAERLLQYIRIPSVSGDGPKGAYNECAVWLTGYLEEVGLKVQIFSPSDNKPIVLATWQGKDPSLPSILLNSHYDVVPVAREHWQHDPFNPTVQEDGMIYGRGIQDMKSVGVQYVEAFSRLKGEGFIPSRNIHLLFVPDEEIGGVDGMEAFLASEQYKSIQPVAFALDEGLANPNDAFTVFYGERVPWWFYVKATGPTGHGSRFIKNTATSKIIDVCNKALAFRAEQEALLRADCGCKHGDIKKRNLGDVTTVNLNMLQSGVSQDGGKTHALNVIPTEAVAGFDVRISPGMDLKKFKAMLDEWCSAEGLSWEFVSWWKNPLHEHYTTSVDDTNIWWKLFKEGCEDIGIPLETEVFPAATDSRFLRQLGIPALGFSPMNKTEILLHEHNERLHKDTFLRGIDVYETLFRRMFTYVDIDPEFRL